MEKNIYEQKSLSKLILTFGIPSILSLIIEMMTGVVDTAFAGNLPLVGGNALSAMALLSPLSGIFVALQTLFAMSTGILIAKYMNDLKRQNKSYVTGVMMSVALSLTTSVVCFCALTWILKALGAEGQVFHLAKAYLQIQLISNVFSSVGYTLTCCIRAFGFPKIEVVIIAGSVAVNIIFNFIFAFLFNMGIRGLALGTLVSESLCAILAILFLMKKNLWIRKVSMSLDCFLGNVLELFKIGISQTIIQILGGCTGFMVNGRILELGSITHVAAWSIVQRIYSLVMMPIVGLTQGVQNIISYFNGNVQQEKIQKVSKLTMVYCSVYGVVALVIMMLWGKNLLAIFGGNLEIIAIAKVIMIVVFMGFPFIGVLYTDMTLLQVTEHEVASVMLILSRQVFFLIPLIYIIPNVFGMWDFGITQVMSLFLCMPIADILATIFAFILKRKISANSKES